MSTKHKELLILGRGNPILSDDSVGLKIVRQIEKILSADSFNVTIEETALSGISLLDIMSGFKKMILVDSIITNQDDVGTLKKVRVSDFDDSIHHDTMHQLNFPSVLDLAKKMQIPVPETIEIFTIEVKDIQTLSENCTSTIKQKLSYYAKNILRKSELLEVNLETLESI